MDATTLLGLAAGGLTTACWAPQLTRSIRTRSLHDLSWASLLVLDTGIALWLAYGLLTGDAAIIAANAVTLVAVLALTTLKWRWAATAPSVATAPVPRWPASVLRE